MLMQKKIAYIFLVSVILAGCSFGDNDDLYDYMNEVKTRKGGKIPPLPEIKTYELFSYNADELRDPFKEIGEEAAITSSVNDRAGVQLDTQRHKETLEAYPIDALKFVGHLEREHRKWAIVTSPDKLVHRVTEGNYIGQNYGKITEIYEDKIAVTEVVSDGHGGWVEREASLPLSE